MLHHFVPPHLGGRNLASLDRELGAPSLHSSTPWGARPHFARPPTRCSVTSFLCTLGGVISLRSTANSVLHHFVPPHLGGRDLALLDRKLGAPSLRSSAPRGGRNLALLDHRLSALPLCSSAPQEVRSRFARPQTRCSVTSFLCTSGV